MPCKYLHNIYSVCYVLSLHYFISSLLSFSILCALSSQVILPSACRRDFQALPEYVREALQVHFASSFDDVFRVAFSKGSSAAGTSAVADTAEDGKKMEATRERMGMDAGLGIRVRMDGHVAEKEMELPSLLPHQQWQ